MQCDKKDIRYPSIIYSCRTALIVCGDQCWAGIYFWTYQLVLVLGIHYKKIHTSLLLVLVFKIYIAPTLYWHWILYKLSYQAGPDIRVQGWFLTDMRQVHTWYLRLIQPWYEAGITSDPYQADRGTSLLLPRVPTRPDRYWYEGVLPQGIPIPG
jgi:hypothetical protein